MCIRKKDGTLRLCVDYRQLNLKTIRESHPLTRLQDALDRLGGNQWFSLLEKGKAYHQGLSVLRVDIKQHLSLRGGYMSGFVYLWD